MKRFSITITSVILSIISLSAQNDCPKWQIGTTFSPEYANSMHKNIRTFNDGGQWRTLKILDFFYTNRGKFGYTIGFNTVFNKSKLFGLEFGLLFSNMGYKKDFPLINERGEIIYNSKEINSYCYFGIPVKANFTFGKSKVKSMLTFGLTPSYLVALGKLQILDVDDNSSNIYVITKSEKSKRFNIFASIGYGVKYDLDDKICLRAIPNLKVGVINANKTNGNNKNWFWNAGVELGLFYAIK